MFLQPHRAAAPRAASPGFCIALLAFSAAAYAQGFPNVARTPGELLAGPVAPEQGRTAIIAWHGERIVSVPEVPGSQEGADYEVRVVNLADPANPEVTILPTRASGFHAHGYYQSGDHLFIGPHCLGETFDPCNGSWPHDFWGDSLRIGGPGMAIGDSQLRRAAIEDDIGLMLGSVGRAGAQAPWGLNDFWTYNVIGDPAWIAVRRNPGDWVYDWSNDGAPTGPAVRAVWNHLDETGVTGFPFIMGNILIWASDQAGTGVATYDISDLDNPVLLDVIKDGNPGGYWPEIYGHYLFFPRRDGEGGPGSQAGFMVVDFSDPTELRVVVNRNLPGSNQYVTFQDEYAFMNNYKIDMRTFDVVLELETVPGVIDTSQFSLPVGNLVVTGGYGLDGPGLAIWAHQAEPDTRGPFVAYHVPVPEQTNYPLELPINLSIPETLRTETIVDGVSLMLRPLGGDPVPTWHAFSQGKILTVTPQAPLLPDTTYEFLLTDGILDAANNPMEPYSFRFSTGGGLAGGNQPPVVGEIGIPGASVAPGASVTFSWDGHDPDGDSVEFRIDFGDGTPRGPWGTETSATHTYTEPGHYQVVVQIRDEHGTVAARTRTITVAAPPAQPNSRASAPLALDEADDRLYVCNPDNDTVAAFTASTMAPLWEAPTAGHPTGVVAASDGSVWVACRDGDAVDVIDAADGALLTRIPLHHGSAPVAVAATPDGQSVLVSCEGDGALRRYAVAGRNQTGFLPLGPWPRAIAITHAGDRALVTRFLSGEHEGRVYDVDLTGPMALNGTIRLARDISVDSAASGRGVPNYLAGIRISPDGQWAWVVGKKDNTSRGTFMTPLMLPGQDSTVRALLMLIDLATGAEAHHLRVDLDNSDSPSSVAFSPLGDYAFIALQGNAQVAVLDVFDVLRVDTPANILRRLGTGIAPRGVVAAGDGGRLYSMDFMDRAVTVFDTAAFVAAGSQNVPAASHPSVARERLHPEVLAGKRIFYHASDPRMSAEGYMSCATCHIDGGHDGRTWDFTNRGEGFRNTTDLRGRSGMYHGNVHWSGNFDEIQDFENDIRAFFGGAGFLSDADHAATAHPLGAPKAGLSPDLDALAAYVASLGASSLPRSPHRESNGALTEAALRGQAVFHTQGCAACHNPATEYTDGLMHNVGTLRASSGQRLGAPLTGIRTPTLLGLHAGAPYFHDGSAATLAEVFTATGGRLVQAEHATLLGGAYGEDVPWRAMKEWHNGLFVELDGPRMIDFDDVESSVGGPGFIEVRYNVRYGGTNLHVAVNGASATATFLAALPNNPGFEPTEWRRVRIPVAYQAGTNSIRLSKVDGGVIAIDDVLFSTPDDAAAANAHVRGLDPGDTADLVAYLLSLDAASAPAPAVTLARDGAIANGDTDQVAVEGGVDSVDLVYIIANPGDGPLNLGQFHTGPGDDGEILAQPAPQLLPGETTEVHIRVAVPGIAYVHGWTDAPATGGLAWSIATLPQDGEGAPEGEGEGEGATEGEGGGGEGEPEGEPGEGETEGATEGEGEGGGGFLTDHAADQNSDGVITLSELLRVIQFYNSPRYGCDPAGEDGYAPNATDETCTPHTSDYNPQDWRVTLSELLRLIQFYNSGGYHPCAIGEDGYCPGSV